MGLLDTDFYKLTQQQAVFHNYPSTRVKYEFKCRNKNNLARHINHIKDVFIDTVTDRFSGKEIDYLETLKLFKKDYLKFLKEFRLNKKLVSFSVENGELRIDVAGTWLDTILFEIPILATVNETYFRSKKADKTAFSRLYEKIEYLQTVNNSFKFCDFGTRRRLSKQWQKIVVYNLLKGAPNTFVGSSNVELSMNFGTRPIGTMAHEFLMAHQVLGDLKCFQKDALDIWAKEYDGKLGIALSDTIGFDAFLKDFKGYYARLYDGVRQDSGDPSNWCKKLLRHYKSLGIDAKTKTAVFSDGLNISKAYALFNEFKDQIKMVFGIGTNLTNDVGHEPLQIVMKMTECNGAPVAKLSDSTGKEMCKDPAFVVHLKELYRIK